MSKSFCVFFCALAGSVWFATAAEIPAPAGGNDQPLTPALLNEIQKSRYIDESVQMTNGNVVGILAAVIYDQSRQPALGAIQVYDNIDPKQVFVAVPWSVLRFDEQSRRIEIAVGEEYLRGAPKYTRAQLDNLEKKPEEIAKLQRSMTEAVGGGAVTATMGTQTGQGSSSLNPPDSNEAQPQRGSVAAIYIMGALAAGIVAVALLRGRRASSAGRT